MTNVPVGIGIIVSMLFAGMGVLYLKEHLLGEVPAFGGFPSFPRPAVVVTPAPVVHTVTIPCPKPSADNPTPSVEVVVKDPPPQIVPVRRNWSLGLVWEPRDILIEGRYGPAGAEIERRLVGDVWGAFQVNWRRGEAMLGVSYEF